jgi:hypothetical protein
VADSARQIRPNPGRFETQLDETRRLSLPVNSDTEGTAMEATMKMQPVLRSLVCWMTAFGLSCCVHAAMESGEAPANPGEPAAAGLGIGFLWSLQSQELARELRFENDFVDTILDERRLVIFDRVKPPVRIACIALALQRHDGRPFRGIKETIELLSSAEIPPQRVIIAYNPERQPGTPDQEINELVESVRRAREMAEAYGAPLLVGPGLREMQQREHLYPELARHCDMWLIQSQRLQLHADTRRPVPLEEYRQGVKRIIERLREGNPEIRIIVQIVTTSERGRVPLSAEQVAATALAIEDLVDAVRVYGANRELLGEVIALIRNRTPSTHGAATRTPQPQ